MKMKTIYIEVKEEDHRYIKQCAAIYGKTIKRFIIDAVAHYSVAMKESNEGHYNPIEMPKLPGGDPGS